MKNTVIFKFLLLYYNGNFMQNPNFHFGILQNTIWETLLKGVK